MTGKPHKYRPNVIRRNCMECGKGFNATRPWNYFHSKACRTKNYSRRIREAMQRGRSEKPPT